VEYIVPREEAPHAVGEHERRGGADGRCDAEGIGRHPGEKCADALRETDDHQSVRGHQSAAELVGHHRLQQAVRDRAVEDHRGADEQQQQVAQPDHATEGEGDEHDRPRHRCHEQELRSRDALPDRRETQRADQPAGAKERQEQTVAGCVEPEHAPRDDRHQREHRNAEDRVDRDHQHQCADLGRLTHVAQRLQHAHPWSRAAGSRRKCGQANHEESAQHGQEAGRIEEEAPRDAKSGDDDGRDGGPDDASEVEAARIQGDGVGQVVASHQVDEHRLARRNLERGDQATHEGEPQQRPDRDAMGDCHGPEHRRLDEEADLGDADEAQLVRPVDQRAGGHREEDDGDRRRGGDEPHEEGAVGELERQPSLRHHLHPRPDQRQRLADEEDAKVSVAQQHPERVERRGRYDGGIEWGGVGHGGNIGAPVGRRIPRDSELGVSTCPVAPRCS
jgi:hypothetical protein